MMKAVPLKFSRSKLFAMWYLSIGAGFTLLGINRLIARAPWWQTAIRLVVAGGFALLGYLEMRFGGKKS